MDDPTQRDALLVKKGGWGSLYPFGRPWPLAVQTESRKYEGGARLRGKKIQLSVPSGDGHRDTEFPDGATLVAEHRRERVSVLAAGFHDFTSNTLRDLDGFGDAPAFGYESGYVRASG